MSLYEELIKKGYTPDEVEETLIRLDCGMEIPQEILKDIREIYKNMFRRI